MIETDLVRRLRQWDDPHGVKREAADEIMRLRAGLTLITCESINAESMAENILAGRDPYFIDYESIEPLP